MSIGLAIGETIRVFGLGAAQVSENYGHKCNSYGVPHAYDIEIVFSGAATGNVTIEGTNELGTAYKVLATFPGASGSDIQHIERNTKYLRVNNGSTVAIDYYIEPA